MNKPFQLPPTDPNVPFYSQSAKFHAAVSQWVSEHGLPLELHRYKESVLRHISRKHPQVVVLGVDKSFLSKNIVAEISTSNNRPTIVCLIDSCSEQAVVECYAQGADRVITLQNSTPGILVALLGRLISYDQDYSPYHINKQIQTISVAELDVRLTKKTFDVAQYLFVNHGKLISKSKILHDLWGLDSRQCLTHRIEVHVSHVRRLLELDGTHGWEMRARRRMGYGIFQKPESLKTYAV